MRIENAKTKIEFCKKMSFGFIDIFSKIKRRANTTKDTDIIELETIFDTAVFDELCKSGVRQILFVYSRSRDVFISGLLKKGNNMNAINVVRKYNTADIPLEVSVTNYNGKQLYLTYSPIHGNITWDSKQKALKKALSLDFS